MADPEGSEFENFTKAAILGAWRVQPNGSAPVVLSHRFGLGVQVTGPEQNKQAKK